MAYCVARRRQNTSYGDTVWMASLTLPVPCTRPSLLHSFLSVVPNVQILVLLTRSTSYRGLANVVLPNLECIETNMSHSRLGRFIERNTSLRALVLTHQCQYQTCPLGYSDGLGHITELDCPLRCAMVITHPGVTRLTAHLPDGFLYHGNIIDVPILLRSFPANSIEYMVLDFHPNDYDILCSLAGAAPNIRKLRLVETSPCVPSVCR